MGMFSFKVGRKESHVVEYSQSRLTGKTEVKLDGKTILSKYVLWNGANTPIKFRVGSRETHDVEITMKVPLWFAMLRASTYSVTVDGKLIETFTL